MISFLHRLHLTSVKSTPTINGKFGSEIDGTTLNTHTAWCIVIDPDALTLEDVKRVNATVFRH